MTASIFRKDTLGLNPLLFMEVPEEIHIRERSYMCVRNINVFSVSTCFRYVLSCSDNMIFFIFFIFSLFIFCFWCRHCTCKWWFRMECLLYMFIISVYVCWSRRCLHATSGWSGFHLAYVKYHMMENISFEQYVLRKC